jgi:hypothetical protein
MIRDRRTALDVRAVWLAGQMPRDCDANQVYYWERGKRTPDIDRMEALIRVLELPEQEAWGLWREASLRKPKQPRPRRAA